MFQISNLRLRTRIYRSAKRRETHAFYGGNMKIFVLLVRSETYPLIFLIGAIKGATESPSLGIRSILRQEGQTVPIPSWSIGIRKMKRQSGQTYAPQRLAFSLAD
jgi:hypothetical protein